MKKASYALVVMVLLATALRLFHLDYRDIWYDEAFTGIAVRENWDRMWQIVISDTHPPLYYILLKPFAAPANYDVFSLRLFSSIWGVIGVIAIYLFGREAFSERAGLYAGFLAALSPFAIQYSQEARMYAMAGALVTLSAFFLIKALKTEKIYYHLIWGFFLGAALLTHYVSATFLVVFFLMFLTWIWPRTTKNRISWRALKRKMIPHRNLILGYAVVFLMFFPWSGYFTTQFNERAEKIGWIPAAHFMDILQTTEIFLTGSPPGRLGMPAPYEIHFASPQTLLALITIAITSLILYLLIKKEKKAMLVIYPSLGTLVIVYILSQLGEHYFVARYLISAAYFLFALLGYFLSKLSWRGIAGTFAAYLFLLAVVINYPVIGRGYNLLEKNVNEYPNKNFYVLNSFEYVVAKYYFGYDRVILYNYDDPNFDPSSWLGVNGYMKRTVDFHTIQNDPQAIILYDDYLKPNNEFKSDDMQIVGSYKNLRLYKLLQNNP